MSTNANVTTNPITAVVSNGNVTATVSSATITASASGGIGPAGPTGPQGATGSSGASDYTQLTNKPSTFPPSSHTHTAAQITDFSSAVAAAAPPTTDASLLTAGTLSASRLPASVVLTTDSRLSDSRTPTTHQHAVSDVTGLQAALDGKQATGSYAAASHTHAAADVSGLALVATSGAYADLTGKPTIPAATTSASDLISGTLADARLSANVVLTSDARLSDSRVPTSHAASHASGGADAITPASIGAASATHAHSAADITSGTLSVGILPASVVASGYGRNLIFG